MCTDKYLYSKSCLDFGVGYDDEGFYLIINDGEEVILPISKITYNSIIKDAENWEY